MAQVNAEFTAHLGPLRGESPLPVTSPGSDWSPVAGWTDVTPIVTDPSVTFDGREHILTLGIAGWALETSIFVPDRQVIVRMRSYSDVSLTHGPWSVRFAGYLTGSASGTIEGIEDGTNQSGTVEARQEIHYLGLTRLPALAFGRIDLARGKPATASSTLPDPAAEAGSEYASATSVDPGQAVDGNRDTVWVSNQVANPTPPAPLNTGKTVRVIQVYDGTGGVGVTGANGRSRALELYAADTVYSTSFEGGNLDGWAVAGSNRIPRHTVTNFNGNGSQGSRSLVVSGPGDTVLSANEGTLQTFGNLTPEVEACVSFALKGWFGDCELEVLIGGGAGEGSADVRRIRVRETAWQRFTFRRAAGRHGTLSVLIRWVFGVRGFMLDEPRVSGGVSFTDIDNRGFWLAYDDGRGGSGYARLDRELDMDSLGGERSLILTDDAELFRSAFDVGDTTIVQWREIRDTTFGGGAGLTRLDFASGRGRLTLASYWRWPDLPGNGGVVWDDVNLATLPPFQPTESLRRTQINPASWASTRNPAFGGANTAGVAWLKVDLGSFPAPTLQANVPSSGTPLTITLDSTAILPAWGNGYLENELVWAEKLNSTQLRIHRTAPVGHAAGSPFYPQVDGQRATLPLLAMVGLRRRNGTAPIQDFSIIGSALPAPRDPATPDPTGGTWGDHDDWFPLVQARGNTALNPTYLIGREGAWTPTSDPPVQGQTQNWGRQVRWLMLVIDRMADGGRAKCNELLAWAADLASGASGQWAGTNPPDARGIVGHILAQHAGVPVGAIAMDRGGDLPGIPWGAGYGELRTAPGTAAEALADLERKALIRVYCEAGGTVRVIPDPLTTAAALAPAERTWTAADIWRLSPSREAAHACAQVRVTARNEDLQATYHARFPSSAMRLGAVVDVADVLLGTQSQTQDFAIRRWRQSRGLWSAAVECGELGDVSPFSRHIISYTQADRAGLVFSSHNVVLNGYSWRAAGDENGIFVTGSVELLGIDPWSS